MGYGLVTYRADRSTIIDGLTKGGVLRDIIFIPKMTQGNKTYADMSSVGNLTWMIVRGGGPDISADLNAGMVRLSWAYNLTTPQSDTTIFVFASNTIGQDQYGAIITNDAGESLADQGYPSPQHVGNQALNTTPDMAYQTPDGYTAVVHSTPVADLRAGANKIVLLALPDVGSNDTWYCLKKDFILRSEGATSVSIVVYTKAAMYNLPSVHIYALDQPIASGDGYALRLYDATNQLTFDSSSECLSGRAVITAGYPIYGQSTRSYPLGAMVTPGISIPYYQFSQQVSSDTTKVNRYIGVMKRVGAQLTSNTILDMQVASTSNAANDASLSGSSEGRYCTTADVSALSPRYTQVTTTTNLSSGPAITTQPNNYIGAGSTTFTVAASGTGPLTYQWYMNGTAIAGATGTSYNYTVSTNDNDTQFFCIVTNPISSARTRTAEVYYDNTSGPTITNVTYPTGNVPAGSTQTVNMTATGSPNPTCQIWLNNSVVAMDTGSASYQFSTTAGTTYNFEARATVQGNYLSHSTSNFFTVTTAQDNPVQITGFTGTTSVQSGNTATYTVNVSGQSPYYISWFKNGSGMGPPNAQFTGTSSSYSFTAASSDNGAKIHCIVSNYPQGNTFQYQAQSGDITLAVSDPQPTAPTPVFSQSPNNAGVYGGQNATFSCSVSNYTSLQWYKNYVAIAGATDTSCTIPTTTSDNGSNFTINVHAVNAPTGYTSSDNWSSNATLSVSAAPPANTFQSYNSFSGSDDGGNTRAASVAVYPDGHCDLMNDWANPIGGGDGSLYEIMATSSGYNSCNTSGFYGVDTWYTLSQGIGWGINPTGATGNISQCSLSFTIRLKSSLSTVCSGSATLRTQNGGTLA